MVNSSSFGLTNMLVLLHFAALPVPQITTTLSRAFRFPFMFSAEGLAAPCTASVKSVRTWREDNEASFVLYCRGDKLRLMASRSLISRVLLKDNCQRILIACDSVLLIREVSNARQWYFEMRWWRWWIVPKEDPKGVVDPRRGKKEERVCHKTSFSLTYLHSART